MKKYILPSIKCHKCMMQPFAIDVYSETGDKEQLSGERNFDEQDAMPNGKDVWSD